MPKIEINQIIQNETVIPIAIISNKSRVVITHVHNHKVVFVRSLAEEDSATYLNILQNVSDFAKTAKTFKKVPQSGQILLVKFHKQFYRAIFLHVFNESFVVALMDYGQIIQINNKNGIFILSKELQRCTVYVNRIFLADVINKKYSIEQTKYLEEIFSYQTELIIDYEGNFITEVTKCNLILSDTNNSINKMLKQLSSSDDMDVDDPNVEANMSIMELTNYWSDDNTVDNYWSEKSNSDDNWGDDEDKVQNTHILMAEVKLILFFLNINYCKRTVNYSFIEFSVHQNESSQR